MLFSEVLFDLINNAALLLALVVLYDSIQVKPPTTRPIAGLIPGMIIGLICLLVMVRPVELVPGIVFDTRTILLGLTGFFFGPVPTAVAAVMAVLFRIYQGGSGVWMGMATIATAAILGLLWRRLRRNRDLPPPWWEFYLFGCVVHGAMLFWMLALPRPFVSAAFTRIGPVVMLLYPLGTALLGTFLCRRQLHHQMEKELLASESRYRNLYENSQAVMWIVDPASGAIVDANEAAVRFYGWEKEQLKKKKVSDINILSEAEIALEMERARTLRRGHFEFRHRLADGSIRDVEVISGPIVLQDRPLLYSIIHDISIRKRAEQALKESEEKYRKYIEHAPCGILIVNGRGEFLEVNDIACRLSGYAREEFSKMTLFDFTLPENRQLSLENFQGLLTTGEYSGIHRYVMKSGALLWCAVNAVRIGEDSLMLFLVDLTEAKHLESLLQEREQQLRRAQRIARLGGWEADLGSGRLQFSAEAGAIFGLDDRAWTLEEVSNLRHPDYRELISQRFKELIEGGRPFDEEYPIRRASDGEHRFVRTIAEYDPQRRLVMGTVQDITLREQAEAALHESEARFRLLVERAPEAIYVGVGPEGRFAYVNPAGLRLFGVASEAELLGLQARGFIHPDCHAAVQERVELLQQGRTDIPPQEEVYLRLDGSPVEVEAIPVPILFRGEKAALVFVRDITERRMAERALKESEAKYRQYIEAAPCGVFVLNGRAEFLEVNDAACRLSGYGREELLGRTPDLFSLPDDKGSVRRYFQELEETGYYAAIDPYANKDGAMVWWSVSAIRTEEGRYIAFVVDMTKEKRLEFLARDWGKQLNRAQRIARLGSWEADLESRRFRPSAEARRIFGLEDRAWTMEEVTNLGLPEYRESIRQKFLKLIQEGGSYDEEYPIQRLNDGATRFIHTVAEYDPERHVVMGTIQDITERQQAEEALRESEARFRSLVENSPYAIYVGSQKRFTYVNRAALRLFGAASEAELLGRPILEHIHPDFRSEVQDRICLLYEKKVLVPPREQVYLRLDGSPVEVEVSPAPIRYQGEDGALVFVHDITKRKAAENALRQERDLFSAGPVFTIGWRPEIPWPVIQVSSNVESILGYSPGEMTCPDFRYADLIHPDDLPRIAREAAGFLAQGRKFEQSYRLRNKNGNYQWFHDFSHLVRDKKGELSIRGYLVDLTSQKKAEKKLAAERQRLANVIEGTNAGTWEWNVPTGETVFNERWAQIAGYSLAELAPVSINTWINLTHPDDLQRSRQMLEKHFARESDYYECECRMRHKDGHWVWVRDCGRVITWGADGKPQHMYGIHMDITAAKKIEKTLKEREATLNSILMAAPAGIVLLRERVVVIWASRGLFDMTGYSEQELIGQNIRMLYPSEEEFERAGKTAYGSIQGREMVELESLWRRKDGAPVQVLIHLAFINPQDPSAGLICAALDISERKKSEELLRASEATLKGILRTAPVAICLLRERVFVWASSHVEAMTGYSEQELIGKSTRFLYPNDKEFERVGKAGYGRVVGRDLAQIETRWRRKDGQLIDLLIHLAPINPADPSEGFIGAVLDISEWKKAERLVRVSEATYRALFNAISAAVSVQDIWDLSVVEANPVFLDIYGYRAGELHNLHPRHFGTLADDADEALCRELRRRVMAGETVNVEIADRGKDGKAILVGKAIRRVNLNGIDRIMTVGQDITERKMMREIMVQTEKIMSLGGLAAGMAHEINNPLSIISQGVQNVLRRTAEPLPANLEAAAQCGVAFDILKEYLEKRNIFRSLEAIREAAGRAARIVENMLDFSRKNDALMAPQDLNRLLEKAIALAATDFDLKKKYDFRHVEIRTEFASLPLISCVETELEQVLLNLLRNAGQCLHEARRPKPLIAIRTRREDPWAVIEVEDNGPGIPAEIRNRIFEPFFTTKKVGEGTGLGLSVSYHIIVQRHRGEMTVDSEPGAWTRFIIRLPLGKKTGEL